MSLVFLLFCHCSIFLIDFFIISLNSSGLFFIGCDECYGFFCCGVFSGFVVFFVVLFSVNSNIYLSIYPSIYEGHTISFQTFSVWALLLIVHT